VRYTVRGLALGKHPRIRVVLIDRYTVPCIDYFSDPSDSNFSASYNLREHSICGNTHDKKANPHREGQNT
jgi:hypothetical protein